MRKKHPKQDYATRNQVLASLGYKSYAEYLQSDLWKRIRTRVMIRDGRKCRLCEEPAYCVHHVGYGKRCLAGKDDKPLVLLCAACHEKIEFKNGKKRSLRSVQTCYDSLWSKVKKRIRIKERKEKREKEKEIKSLLVGK